jgi:hypothetical protein
VLREDIDGIDEFEAVIEVWEKVDWGQVEEGILDKLLVHPVINNFNTPSSTRTTQKHTQNWEHSNESQLLGWSGIIFWEILGQTKF